MGILPGLLHLMYDCLTSLSPSISLSSIDICMYIYYPFLVALHKESRLKVISALAMGQFGILVLLNNNN